MWNEGVLGQNGAVAAAWQAHPLLLMPVLVVFGDCDNSMLPNVLRRLGSIAPDAIMRILPDCSHWIPEDAPDEFNPLLRSFLAAPGDVL
jgi:pimeloyl-ACP methyl ester carboxylesterase